MIRNRRSGGRFAGVIREHGRLGHQFSGLGVFRPSGSRMRSPDAGRLARIRRGRFIAVAPCPLMISGEELLSSAQALTAAVRVVSVRLALTSGAEPSPIGA
jgi:hypothetical protein